MFNSSVLVPDGITWLLLATSVVSLFINQKYWPYLLSATLATGYWQDRLSLMAILVIITGLGIAALARKVPGKWKVLLHSMVLAWAIALALHLIPGFNNILVLNKVLTGPHSVPFTMYLNLDKPMIIFALLLLVPGMLGNPRPLTIKQYAVLASGLLLLPAMAFGLGLVRAELSLPDWLWVFALNNLLFTCVAEEALFRGYIQRLLSQRFNHWVGIAVASLLFGLAHFAGGPLFILVAGCAGALYGLTYYWTGRLSLAIAIHFGFNLIHLVFFTYPIASPAY